MWRHSPNALRSPCAWLLCRLRRSQKSNYSKTSVRLALKFYGATYPGPNRFARCSTLATTESSHPHGNYYYLFISSKWMLRGSLYDVWMRWKPRSSKQNYAILFVQSTFLHTHTHTGTRNGFADGGKIMASTPTNDRVNSEFNWCWFNNKAKERTKMRREPQTRTTTTKKKSVGCRNRNCDTRRTTSAVKLGGCKWMAGKALAFTSN